MNENKELFLEEYTKICKKYNLMFVPDEMAAFLLQGYDEKFLDDMLEETKRIENYRNPQKLDYRWDF